MYYLPRFATLNFATICFTTQEKEREKEREWQKEKQSETERERDEYFFWTTWE